MENTKNINAPSIISGNVHTDERGSLVYNNNFILNDSERAIKRMYFIQAKPYKLRGWQGHKLEQKWFFAAKGSLKLLVVQPDNWENPSHNLKPMEYILKEGTGDYLHVPAGYATAQLNITEDAVLGVLSDFSLEESQADSYRFDSNMWYFDSYM